MSRSLVMNRQPDMYARVRVWRKGEPLLGGAIVCAVPGEWGSILWSNGECDAAPDLFDEWEPEKSEAPTRLDE